ncbi:MAG: hypothetical protein K8L99_25275 [Anaerolineae bacterium]|nr:hypothetical protein [Anaerolineae bacterium]
MSAKQLGLLLVLLVTLLTTTAVLAQETPLPPTPAGDVEDVAEGLVDLTVGAAEGTAVTLDSFLARLISAPQTPLVRILFILGGVILLVAGWRVYDFIVIIAGFLIGASIAVSLVGTDNTFLVIAALLIGGLIGAALGIFLYYVAVFVIGAYIGILITNAIASALALTPISPVILLIGGLIGGLVLIGLSFEFLVLLSSLVGAQLLTLALGLNALWLLVFAVIGIIIQLALIRSFNYDFRRRRRVRLFRRST